MHGLLAFTALKGQRSAPDASHDGGALRVFYVRRPTRHRNGSNAIGLGKLERRGSAAIPLRDQRPRRSPPAVRCAVRPLAKRFAEPAPRLW